MTNVCEKIAAAFYKPTGLTGESAKVVIGGLADHLRACGVERAFDACTDTHCCEELEDCYCAAHEAIRTLQEAIG